MIEFGVAIGFVLLVAIAIGVLTMPTHVLRKFRGWLFDKLR